MVLLWNSFLGSYIVLLSFLGFGSHIHFFDSINLKSLQEEQSRNFISSNSRSSNSIAAFRFSKSPLSTDVSRPRPALFVFFIHCYQGKERTNLDHEKINSD